MLPILFSKGTLGSRMWVPGWGPTIPVSDSGSPSVPLQSDLPKLQTWPCCSLLRCTQPQLCPPHPFGLPGSALLKLVSEFPPALVVSFTMQLSFHLLKGALPSCPVIPNNINTFYFSVQNRIPTDIQHQNR